MTTLDPQWIFLAAAAPCVGSFIGLVGDRLPKGESILRNRSHCATCGETLALRDLVPVIGWAVNRGRCRNCGAPVSALYPAIEVAALAVALWSLWLLPGWLAYAGAVFGWGLLALSVIDARAGVLPDALTLPLLAGGLATAALFFPERLLSQTIGAVLGLAVLWGASELYRRVRGREGMGAGDAVFLGAIGAWVGWDGLASVVLIAAASGLGFAAVAAAVKARPLSGGASLPFGPFLALGAWTTWLYGPLMLA